MLSTDGRVLLTDFGIAVHTTGPFGEGGDGGALALAGGRRQVDELGQVGADRRGGQLGDLPLRGGRRRRSGRRGRRAGCGWRRRRWPDR
ncbi:hypothetical protein [Nonomuraea sp. B19D2]|uniref:hypothetical protein n=1 Tax=Nonomuraea sp. B19D2 TaxID=3159561 RepID=UPI0032DABBB9